MFLKLEIEDFEFAMNTARRWASIKLTEPGVHSRYRQVWFGGPMGWRTMTGWDGMGVRVSPEDVPFGEEDD